MTEYVLDGRYALIERIATGGMGEVWRGTDQVLGRPVAIKLLSTAHAGDEQFRARFRAEARYAAALSHPGIARVFDYGESSPLGGPYLIMELVNGEPLSAILERAGRLSPDNTLDIISQAALALDAAHQAGIVHRDIKPGNLLIMADGTTKITDFGIAKARALDAVNLTATGIVMGTALYVSPEQATGATVTGSSDIYSLGVVAYECLTGHPPFIADQPLAIAIMHKHNPVPPLPPDVPKPLGDLVLGMLAKTPDGRPESARHVADRAGVIRDARARSGTSGPFTADLPVVPDFPDAAGNSFDDTERTVGSRLGNRRLAAAAAGVGVGLCGVGAIVAVLLTSGGNSGALTGATKSPAQSASQAAPPATASVRTSSAGGTAPGTNLESTSQTTATQPAQPTASRTSPTPTQDAPPTSAAPSVSASKSTSPSASATTPTTSTSTSATPTATSSSPTSAASGQANQALANEG